MTAVADVSWDGFGSWMERCEILGRPKTSLNPITYAPIGDHSKPFIYQGKRFTRDQLIEMGLDVYARDAILRY